MNAAWPRQFGLNRNPFKDTLETDLFYRTRQHEEALVKITIGIEDSHALILLSGVSGTGKTLLSQLVIRGLDENRFLPLVVPVYPGMGKGMLLAEILAETGCADHGRFTHERLALLQQEAIRLHDEGRRLVIVIDEAHFLKADALHVLRTLSNLETEQEKLVTVLLVAENSLGRRLAHPSYASLRGRITFAVNLEPLTAAETEQFVKFRLLKCGGPPQLLSDDAYGAVHQLSGGIPREINRLLYNGFLEAVSGAEQSLTSATIRTAGRKADIRYGKSEPHPPVASH